MGEQTPPRARRGRRRWRRYAGRAPSAGVAALLLAALLVANVALDPHSFAPAALGTTFGLMAPLLLAAIAMTPVSLSGGFDLSVGPLMALVNAVVVHWVLPSRALASPLLAVSAALAVGLASGLPNGVLANLVRIPAAVATLYTYFVYSGLALLVAPTPGGSIPAWLAALAGGASALPVVAVLLVWWAVTRTSFYEQMLATGGDDRAAYANGVDVTTVRMGAYLLGGLFGGAAGLSLTALLNSANATIGPSYTLTAIAAVALGGVSFAGGRGAVTGSAAGAAVIFLTQNLLTPLTGSHVVLQTCYGAMLLLSVALNALIGGRPGRAGRPR